MRSLNFERRQPSVQSTYHYSYANTTFYSMNKRNHVVIVDVDHNRATVDLDEGFPLKRQTTHSECQEVDANEINRSAAAKPST